MLKQEYKEEGIELSEALKLAVKVLSKTLDVQKLTSEKGKIPFYPINLYSTKHSHEAASKMFLYQCIMGAKK